MSNNKKLTKSRTSKNSNKSKTKNNINKLPKILCIVFALALVFGLVLLLKSCDRKATVDFYSNGGSKIESLEIMKGEKLKRPKDPTKDYYIFEAWYTDKALTHKYDFSSKVTKDLTLYAGYYLDGKRVSVDIDEDYLYLNVNEVYKVYANITPDNLDIELVWSTSDSSVAIVDSNGHVTGISDGSAVITVSSKDGMVTDSVNVYVIGFGSNQNANDNKPTDINKNVPVTNVSFDDADGLLTLVQGASKELGFTINPSNATNKKVEFESSDPSVATVDENGNVTGVAPGTAIITITTEDGKKTDTIEVTVTEPDTVIDVDSLVQAGVSSTNNSVVEITKNDRTLNAKPKKANIAVSELFSQNFRGALLDFLNTEGIKNIEVYVDGVLITITKDGIDTKDEAVALISSYVSNQENLYGREFSVVANLEDGYVSENGNKSETYTIKVEEPEKVTVTFTSEGSTVDTKEVYVGEAVDAPTTNPTKEHADFVEWQDESGNTFDFSSAIESDTTIVAYFDPWDVVDVDAAVNAGVSSTSNTYISDSNSNHIVTLKAEKANITIDEMINQGFRGAFINFLETEGIENVVVTVDSTTITITKEKVDAQSEAISLIAGYINDQESLYGKEFSAVVNLKDKYVSENDNTSETYTIKIEAPDKVTVTFSDRGNNTDVEIYKGAKVTKPADPVKEHAEFDAWYNGNERFNFDNPVTSDITLTARFSDWSVVDVDSLVTTEVGNTNTSVIEITKDDRNLNAKVKKLNITTSDIEGQNFRGTILDFLNTEGIKNIEVDLSGNTITITKNGVDTKDEAIALILNYINDQTSLYGLSLTVTANLEDGYVSENGNVSETYTINVVAPDVTVTYKDGDIVLTTTSTLYNTTLTANYLPSKDGYTFVKWINEDGSDFDSSVPLTSDIALNAVWNKIVSVDSLVQAAVSSTNNSVVAVTKSSRTLNAKLSRINLTATDLQGQNFRGSTINFVSQEGIENIEVYIDGNLVATITKDEIDTRDEALALISGYLNDLGSLENADIKLVANLKEGYVSENNNTSEEYTFKVEMPDKVTVRFMTSATEVFATEQVYPGEAVSTPTANPTKENATFDNWYKDQNFTEVYDFSEVITENTDIYAKFDSDTLIDVDSLVTSGVSGINSDVLSVNKNNNIITIKALKRNITVEEVQNQGFRGRLLNFLNAEGIDSITIILANNESVSITKEGIDTTSEAISLLTPFIQDQSTLYGTNFSAIANLKEGYSSVDNGTKHVSYTIEIEAPDMHTVSFKDGNNTLSSEDVYNLEKVARPADPMKNNYTFDNWYKDSLFNELFDFNTNIENDTNIFAKFNANTHTVTFMNETVQFEVQNVNEGNAATNPVMIPQKEGYTFTGWRTETGAPYDFSTPVTSDITLYAEFEINTYTVTFDTNGSNEVYSDVIVEYNNTVANPGTPSKDGYRFNYWTLNGNSYDFSTLVTEDITLVANYTKEYTVTFNTNGGTTVDPVVVLEGDKITEPLTTRREYVLTGWYKDSSFNTEFNFNDEITEDTVLYVKWERLEDIHSSVTNSVNSVNGNYFNAEIDPNANDVTVTFTNSGLSTTMLGMLGQLTDLLDGFATNDNYSSVYLSYGTRSVDIKSASATDLARMLGYIGKGSYSGSTGIGVTGSDLAGKTVQVTVNLVDGYASENGNSSETYNLHFN